MKEIYDLLLTPFLTEKGQLNLLGKLTYAMIVLMLTTMIVKVINKGIRMAIDRKLPTVVDKKKVTTISLVIGNTLKYLGYFIAAVIILDLFGINTTSIIATAGVGGIALAFGAQSLVNDIISGAFILMENQYNVGDFITVSNLTGTVEEIGLRITKIRDYAGSLYLIPNGTITTVVNASKGPQKADVQLRIPYDVTMEQVRAVVETVSKGFEGENGLLAVPTVQGVTATGEFSYTVNITATTRAGDQWKTQRALREALLKECADRGINLSKGNTPASEEVSYE